MPRKLRRLVGASAWWTRSALWFATAVIAGIIGGRSDAEFVLGTNALSHSVTVNLLWLCIVGILLVGVIVWLLVRLKVHDADAQRVFTLQRGMQASYQALLSQFAIVVQQSNPVKRDREMARLLETFLRTATQSIPVKHTTRSILLRPNAKATHLIPWVADQMPRESLRKVRWDISPNENINRTIGAQVYLDARPRLVKWDKGLDAKPSTYVLDHQKWVPDHESNYVIFKHPHPSKPRYESFVVLPVTGEQDQRLGVITIDSKELDAFNDSRLIPLLVTLQERIGPVIATYHALRQADQHRGKQESSSGSGGRSGLRTVPKSQQSTSSTPERLQGRLRYPPRQQQSKHGNRVAKHRGSMS